ncbi:MAG: G8 domain-containing protein [Catalinimonas sp.]
MKKLLPLLAYLLMIVTSGHANDPNRGYVTHSGDKFVWSNSGEAFVPNWNIFNYDRTLDEVSTADINNFVQEMMGEHGFNGAHVIVYGEWFHIGDRLVRAGDSNFDQRTFDKLKQIINAVYAAGGSTHIWQWGDDNRSQTSRSLNSGFMGSVERQLLDKIHSELNNTPGWTMGIGFDVFEWANESELKTWHDYLKNKPGQNHMFAARSNKNRVDQIYDGLDYSSYEYYRPSYDELVQMLTHLPGKPSSSDDRYRVRNREKDVTPEETVELLWRHTIAGGVGGIWGNLKQPDGSIGESRAYPNKEVIKTFFTFWNDKKRFRKNMVRDNSLTDGWCLRDGNSHYVYYKDNTNSITYTFQGGNKRVIAVNTKAGSGYQEIDLGTKSAGTYTWNAPSNSDWAIAVGDFGSGGTTNNLAVSPASRSFGAGASSQNVSVTSNVSWTATDDRTWISVSPAGGSNNGTVSISVQANTGSSSRSGTVTISGGGQTETVAVTQAAQSQGSTTRLEAESAVITNGGLRSENSASGNQFVDLNTNGSLSWSYQAPQAGSQTLSFAIIAPSGSRSMGVFVNNSKVGVISTTNRRFDWDVESVQAGLNQGSNQIELRDSEGTPELDVDYLEVSGTPPVTSTANYWSNPATWGGSKPVAGQNVTIAMGDTVVLDEDTPDLGGLMIMGVLKFARQNVSLTADYISVMGGELEIGTAAEPFAQKAVVTLNDTDTNFEMMMGNHGGTRGIGVMNGGKLTLHGATPNVLWTKLNDHAPVGATQLTLKENVGWAVGDEIVIGPTDFYEARNGASITHKRVVTNVSGNTVTLDQPLDAFFWGKLQYVTDAGMSLTPGTYTGDNTYAPDFGEPMVSPPTVLDERAPVGLLTRNIVIQSADDALWQNEGFGAHIMIMPGGTGIAEGVEIKRGGQAGRIRRYPWHWHVLSYQNLVAVGDATGQYFNRNTIHTSANRGIVIHGTNGVDVEDNVVYDVRGHGIFFEDAVERRVLCARNLVLKVRSPEARHELLAHEFGAHGRGVSGIWLSNPDNTIVDNHVGDSQGVGIWMAYPAEIFGPLAGTLNEFGAPMVPRMMRFGAFDGNTTHSTKADGVHNDNPQIDAAGSTGNSGIKDYTSTASGNRNVSSSNWLRFTVNNTSMWKCGRTAFWERANRVNNYRPISADNKDVGFAKSGFNGLIAGALAVGESLNHNKNNVTRPYIPAALATYHHTFQFDGCIVINHPAYLNRKSGAFDLSDYYLRPVEKGQWQTEGMVLINAHPGVKLTAYEGVPDQRNDPNKPHYNQAGAVYDPQGLWGPANTYFVFDEPFYTYGETKHLPAGISAALNGGVSVQGPFYGIDGFEINDGTGVDENQRMGLEIFRYNAQDQVVGSQRLWSLSAAPSNLLANMRDFALHHDGYYEVEFPENTPPDRVQVGMTNLLTTADVVIVGFEFDGQATPAVRTRRYSSMYSVYTAVNSFSALKNSAGETFWQDSANDKIWVKIRGGVRNAGYDEYSWEDYTYQDFWLEIYDDNAYARVTRSTPTVSAASENGIMAYPNPTNGRLTVRGQGELNVELIDMTGRLVSVAKAADEITLDMRALPAGIYQLRVNGHNRRIVKQ